MKYIVFDERRDGAGDTFTKEFDEETVAVAEAKFQWSHLTNAERKANRVYVLKSADPDEEADNHFDGDYVWSSDFKCYRNIDTGEIWTEEEAEGAYEQFAHEMPYANFEEYMDEMLRQGRDKEGGLEEI